MSELATNEALAEFDLSFGVYGGNPPSADGGVRKRYQHGSGKGLSLSATGTWFPLL
jgi:hypothetical protein